jgi:uncharacterized protein (TIGR02266 family)
MINPNAEKRRPGMDRAGVEIDVDLSTLGPYYLSKLTNLSIGGAFIQHPQPASVGTELTIKFVLPNQPAPIQARAKVAWTYIQPGQRIPNGTGMGIQFTNIDAQDENKIKQYVHELTTLDPEDIEPTVERYDV